MKIINLKNKQYKKMDIKHKEIKDVVFINPSKNGSVVVINVK